MRKLITTVASLGSSAATLYTAASKSAGNGVHASILKALSKSERELERASLKTAREIKKSPSRCPLRAELNGLREITEDSFSFLCASAASDTEAFLECLLQYEYHRWTGLIMPLAASLKPLSGAAPLLIAAQRHKRRVERLLSSGPHPKDLLFRFSSSDPVWVERLLVVGSPAKRVPQRNDVAMYLSPHASDAIERLRERYYAAVITDLDPDDAVDLCKKASKAYPGIEERFLFLHGPGKKGRDAYFRGLRRVRPPSSADLLASEISRILDR